MGTTEKFFIREHESALNESKLTSFHNLIAKHAALMINLAIDKHKEKTRSLMRGWVKVDNLNDQWVALICPVVSLNDEEFYQITKKLVGRYTDLLGDYIVDGTLDPAYVKKMIRTSTKFYEKVAAKNVPQLKTMWEAYTNAVVEMADELVAKGKTHNFHVRARGCIIAGRMLGAQLDHSLFLK